MLRRIHSGKVERPESDNSVELFLPCSIIVPERTMIDVYHKCIVLRVRYMGSTGTCSKAEKKCEVRTEGRQTGYHGV